MVKVTASVLILMSLLYMQPVGIEEPSALRITRYMTKDSKKKKRCKK